jgi:hypothetical protein
MAIGSIFPSKNALIAVVAKVMCARVQFRARHCEPQTPSGNKEDLQWTL